jgi:hypothetical protein
MPEYESHENEISRDWSCGAVERRAVPRISSHHRLRRLFPGDPRGTEQ